MSQAPILAAEHLNLYYSHGAMHALKNVNMQIQAGQITALIGPSGCGKSTFIKSINRMNDLVAVSYTHLDLYKRQIKYRI